MDEETYINTQTQIMLIGGLVRELPLQEFIEAIGHSESWGPILDPTLFRAASANLSEIKALAVSLQSFQNTVLRLSEKK